MTDEQHITHWVRFEDAEHVVVAIEGTTVRLVSNVTDIDALAQGMTEVLNGIGVRQ